MGIAGFGYSKAILIVTAGVFAWCEIQIGDIFFSRREPLEIAGFHNGG